MNFQPVDFVEYLGEVSKWYRQAPVNKSNAWWIGRTEVMMDDMVVGRFDYVEDFPAYVEGNDTPDNFTDFKIGAREVLYDKWMSYEAELAHMSNTGTGSKERIAELVAKRNAIGEAMQIISELVRSDCA